MDFTLNKSQKEIQKAAWEFAKGEFDKELILELSKTQEFPKNILKKAGELGFVGIHYPESVNGGGMGLLENVLVGQHIHLHGGLLSTLLNLAPVRRQERQSTAYVRELLAFVGLAEKENWAADNLAYGEQRRLEIARALALKPRLLLLDEPAAGMNPRETEDLMALIAAIQQLDITVLLIEHDMNLVMNISKRIVVFDHGRVIAQGTPRSIRQNPQVIAAYLGKEEDEGDV